MLRIVVLAFFTLSLFFCHIQSLYCQNEDNVLYVGTNQYKASNSVSFQFYKDGNDHYLNVSFAKKNDDSGLLFLQIQKTICEFNEEIEGDLYLYLEDGIVIKCIDRGYADNVDCSATNLYFLTKYEISKLKESSINSIRFSFDGYNFSAKSSYSITIRNSYTFKYSTKYYNNKTEEEVNILYNK